MINMKLIKYVIATVILLVLLSCGGNSESQTTQEAEKEVSTLDSLTNDLEESQKAIKAKSDELEALLKEID